MKRYVALGSSMAAGPGIRPRAAGAPWRAGRSARNYPHLVASQAGLDLIDVTYSGATTAHVLSERQNGAAPQLTALNGTEAVVTVTIGGNDVGYVPMLLAASVPSLLRYLPLLGGRLNELLDRQARDRALWGLLDSLCEVGRSVRRHAPRARIFFVDYLTILPPADESAWPLSDEHAELGRHVAQTLERLTAEAAAATDCEVVSAAAASRNHHAWSQRPWTTMPSKTVVPLPGRPAPLHPNEAGMRAVADLVLQEL
ncbi:SGNH/GDSL hydrolase family protein [Mycobacterium vicinigordonae]|uniref:SGNH/GDSL hydrolase family protein n=1 Tax=Mycobacterium vicinigordonae TaxID=1719132 RepID=A0A7D6E2U9_9MYCO|nr:SGNH/GDSL hydrolase family protein [Mycobacterium vicinigordonae]QLL09969.1 SGNH/GDSL hydrolase family protein [Mycobacterium vicinigordonae]